MNSQIKGRVWKFGDDINTDIISPGEYMDASYEDIGKHAMERAYPGFADAIEKGDIIVAGSNFGPGSSRETAQIALKCILMPIAVIAALTRRIHDVFQHLPHILIARAVTAVTAMHGGADRTFAGPAAAAETLLNLAADQIAHRIVALFAGFLIDRVAHHLSEIGEVGIHEIFIIEVFIKQII